MLAVGALAFVWARWASDPTAAAIRRVFGALDPVVVLEVAAALVVAGIGLSLARALTGRPLRVTLPPLPHVPTAVVLAAIVAVAAVPRVALGAAKHLPQVLGDELIYAGLAKGWALHGEPVLRGSVEVGYSLLYPLFLAPAFRLTTDGAAGLEAAKAMNAVAMALVAVPAFALARRVVPRGWALGVAALSALAPWTAYTALTMTEPLFYPVFVGFAAVLAWTLERPTILRQAAMLGLLAVLVGVRTQAVAVGLGAVAAILVYAWLGGGRATLRRFLPTFGVLAAVVVFGLAAKAAGIALPTSTYDSLYRSLSDVGAILKWAVWNVGSFELTLGVLALAAFPLALGSMLRSSATPAERSTGVVALTLSLAVLASVALLSAGPYGLDRLHERNLFFVTPLLLVCLAHWLRGGLERPRWPALACGLAVLVLAAVLPEDLVFRSNSHDAPSFAFFNVLEADVPDVPFRVWTIAIAAAGVGTFLLAKRPLFPLLTVVLAFAAIAARIDYSDLVSDDQARSLAWIDEALPPGARATLVHLGITHGIEPCASAAYSEQHELVIWSEYFNTRIDKVRYVYVPNALDGFGHHELTLGEGGLILDGGRPFEREYVVIDSRQPLTGREVARYDLTPVRGEFRYGGSLTLWQVDPPLRFFPLPQPLPPRADGRPC